MGFIWKGLESTCGVVASIVVAVAMQHEDTAGRDWTDGRGDGVGEEV